MDLEGVVQNGVIVPDDASVLPEGTRVRILPAPPVTLGIPDDGLTVSGQLSDDLPPGTLNSILKQVGLQS